MLYPPPSYPRRVQPNPAMFGGMPRPPYGSRGFAPMMAPPPYGYAGYPPMPYPPGAQPFMMQMPPDASAGQQGGQQQHDGSH